MTEGFGMLFGADDGEYETSETVIKGQQDFYYRTKPANMAGDMDLPDQTR
jgi:hypothetical protein